MFGSNFFGNFGIPEQQQAFPYQGADAQGGLLGANAPVQSPMSQNDASQPAAGQPAPTAPAALGPSSPLSSAALMPNPGAGSPQPNATPDMTQQAPAAGIATPFGRPNG